MNPDFERRLASMRERHREIRRYIDQLVPPNTRSVCILRLARDPQQEYDEWFLVTPGIGGYDKAPWRVSYLIDEREDPDDAEGFIPEGHYTHDDRNRPFETIRDATFWVLDGHRDAEIVEIRDVFGRRINYMQGVTCP